MRSLFSLLAICCFFMVEINAQFVKEYVRSFALKNSDSILFELHIPFEIIEWDRPIVRTITQVESFSFSDEVLRKLIRQGRYSVIGKREENVLRVSMPELFHAVTVQGVALHDEVVAEIYVPRGTFVEVICETKSPENQLRDLWMQQEILTRKINSPIKKAIDIEYYAAVRFQEGLITEVEEVNGSKKYLQLKVLSNGKEYKLVSRFAQVFDKKDLLNKKIIFIAHDFTPERKKLPNEGMILIHENKKGQLVLLNKEDIPSFLFVSGA